MIGETISHYRIEARLGEGGMGVVYRAQDTRLGRPVAIKFLSEAVRGRDGALERFVREARAASALNHPNICTLHDVGEHEGRPFLVVELLEGETLARRLERGPLPPDLVLDLGLQMAQALEAAHAAHVVHRDIKPANLFLTADGRVKLLDFGLARLGGTLQLDSGAATLSQHTAPGAVLGTVGYMSPEQVEARAVDSRSDIFALGAVLYEMATGRRAFGGASAAAVFDAIRHDTPPPAHLVHPPVPEALSGVIARALEKDAALRYQHAADLRSDLARIRRDRELSAGTSGVSPSRRPRPGWLPAAGILVVLGLAVGAWALRGRDARIDSIAVLPFANATGDPEMEYLSDGLTVSLINRLTDLRQLRVKSRVAVFRFKEARADPIRAGRDLGVRAVVAGTVRRRGDLLVVETDLVETSTGDQVWGEQFTRRASDLLALEDDIARGLAERLAVRLTPEDARRASRRYTEDNQAYDLYLRGSFHASTFREEGLERAIEHYRRALAVDPRFALAYTGLAHAYFWFTDWYAPSREVSPLALEAARSALAIDDRLADARGLLALVTFIYEWDWPLAEREFRLALQLDPAAARTRAYFAWLLASTGRGEEAAAEARRAQADEALSAEVDTIAALALSLARRHEDAAGAARRAIALDPAFTWAHILLGRSMLAQGRAAEAVVHLEEARRLEPRLPEAIASLACGLAAKGDLSGARARLAELLALARERHVAPFDVAMVHAALGDGEQALAWLERAHAERSYLMPSLATFFVFDRLRADPRFQALVRRMDLPAPATPAAEGGVR